jgi:hypothetical protein
MNDVAQHGTILTCSREMAFRSVAPKDSRCRKACTRARPTRPKLARRSTSNSNRGGFNCTSSLVAYLVNYTSVKFSHSSPVLAVSMLLAPETPQHGITRLGTICALRRADPMTTSYIPNRASRGNPAPLTIAKPYIRRWTLSGSFVD